MYTFDEIYSWGASDLQTFEFRVLRPPPLPPLSRAVVQLNNCTVVQLHLCTGTFSYLIYYAPHRFGQASLVINYETIPQVASERLPYSFKTMHAQEIEAKLEVNPNPPIFITLNPFTPNPKP